MTITLEYLRQPNKAKYLMALLGLDITGVHIHWRLCARVINTYRRHARGAGNDLQVKEHFEASKEEGKQEENTEGRRIEQRHRSKKAARINKNPGSRKNAKVRNSFKLIKRLTSAGKGRPTRKRKIQFKSVPITIHMSGSKYNGGHHFIIEGQNNG